MAFNPSTFQAQLLTWFSKYKRDLPWRKAKTPYRVWISEIMLQQTQVKTVIPYYDRWLKAFPTLESLSKASLDKVYKFWEGLGYYSRARNLKKGADYIQTELNGKFPDMREGLLKIPGVGPYTAGAIASIAYGRPEPLVDGNVGRVFARLFEIPGIWNEAKTNQKLWEKARELLSIKNPGEFNEALMELGATVCAKDNPQCYRCPVSKFCLAFQKGTTGKYPTTKKSQIEKVEKVTLLIRKNGKVLVRRKKLGRIMGGLWEFPTIEKEGREFQDILKTEKIALKNAKRIGQVSHGYTRFKATLDIWQGLHIKGSVDSPDYEKPKWVNLKNLSKITFPSVYRKIASQLYGEDGA